MRARSRKFCANAAVERAARRNRRYVPRAGAFGAARRSRSPIAVARALDSVGLAD